MSKDELLKRLQEMVENHGDNPETVHVLIDWALLEYVDDERITELYNSLDLWYA